MMDLKTSTIHRRLETHIKIVGMDLFDLLFVLLFSAVMNLIFGSSAIGIFMVFVVPAIFAMALFLTKRNRPEQYLLHLLRFHLMPGYFSAGADGKFEELRKKKIYE